MIIINKTSLPKYSSLASRSFTPGARSADIDMGGFTTALESVVKMCGNSFVIRLNNSERMLLSRLQKLDEEGMKFKVMSNTSEKTYFKDLLLKENKETCERIASIKAEREKEESIRSETTYASRRDIDSAIAKARNIRGEIEAKKLDQKDVTGTVSLTDLMGDNKFIENNLKNSKIRTAVAAEEGWDVEKINKANESLDPVKSSVNETVVESTTYDSTGVDEKELSNARPHRGRRSRK